MSLLPRKGVIPQEIAFEPEEPPVDFSRHEGEPEPEPEVERYLVWLYCGNCRNNQGWRIPKGTTVRDFFAEQRIFTDSNPTTTALCDRCGTGMCGWSREEGGKRCD